MKSFSSGKSKEKGEKRKLTPGRLPEEKHGLQAQVGVGDGRGVLVDHPGHHSRIQFATRLPSISAGRTEMLWLSRPRNVSFSWPLFQELWEPMPNLGKDRNWRSPQTMGTATKRNPVWLSAVQTPGCGTRCKGLRSVWAEFTGSWKPKGASVVDLRKSIHHRITVIHRGEKKDFTQNSDTHL